MKNRDYKGIYLKFNKVNDADIIKRLSEQKNTQGYIKDLIRTDIDLDIFRKGIENGVVKIEESKEDSDNT